MHCSPTLDRRKLDFPGCLTMTGWLRHRDNARQSGRYIRSRYGVGLRCNVYHCPAGDCEAICREGPIFQLFAGVGKAHEPMRVQALCPELAVEGEEGSGNSPGDCWPRRKMKPLSVGFPGREKSRVTPFA
ncbi:hypothetical protein ANTHELSMS3_05069 (plasmid) [Antarctobacter heliothermus]|uniref:Uncharacterized protein n=1 Tax=Antarctobacter heliothermus TaxID=74033 RepID=A0A222EB73_9RHOB|nr:hypothetical protein ANTHELSMS3_05069 [Antarctobacter heliothermus]